MYVYIYTPTYYEDLTELRVDGERGTSRVQRSGFGCFRVPNKFR